jgi:hypothetical protein
MERVTKSVVEGVVVAGGVDCAEVVAVGPVTLFSQLRLNAVEETRAWQGIRERHADIIGARLANQVHCLADFGPTLTGVAKLEEVTCTYAGGCEPFSSAMNCGELQSLFHRIEDLLRTRLDAHPYLDAARSFQS